jgi:hypothetical protein
LAGKFRGTAACKVGSGTTVLFWSDVWNEQHLQYKYPRLYSFGKIKDISVAQFLTHNIAQQQFHLPLSVEAFQKYQNLQQLIQQIQITDSNDTWHYI